jgi:ribosomal protein S18 acetylase RimI-like enzyme
MVLSGGDMDRIVYDVLVDCLSVHPPLDRTEVAQHVVDHVSEEIRKEVYASLERMVENGEILRFPGAADAQPYRYRVPPVAGGRH